MVINDIVQTIAEARVDARSLSEFVFKPADSMVQRRLAPPINTLEYYLNLFNKTATDGAAMMNQVIINSGFVIIDSFELGATLTQRNQALRHAADGKLYRWAGDLPKVVPASSTPTSTGGLGANAWLEVSDTTLRQDLAGGVDNGKGALTVRGASIYVKTIADLKALPRTSLTDGQAVHVNSYFSGGKEGGGTFVWKATDVTVEDGGVNFALSDGGVGRFVRNLEKSISFYDFGIVDGDAYDIRNSAQYKLLYAYMTRSGARYGTTVIVPPASFFFSEPVFVSSFIIIGSDGLSGSSSITLTQAVPNTFVESENLGAWGTIDYTGIIAPVIVSSGYYGGALGIRVSTSGLENTEVTHGIYVGLARYHNYDNLVVNASAAVGFEVNGGFMSNFGTMEIRRASAGVVLAAGSAGLGGNTATFKNLWIIGTTGMAFYSHGMTDLSIDNLYLENIEAGAPIDSLIYLRTAKGMRIGTILLDGIRAQVGSYIKLRGCTGHIGALSFAGSSSPTNKAWFGLNGGVGVTVGTVTTSGTPSMFALAKKEVSYESSDSIKITGRNTLPINLTANANNPLAIVNSTVRSYRVGMGATNISSVLLQFKSDRGSQNIICSLDIIGESSLSANFSGRLLGTIKIASDNTVTTDIVQTDLGGVTPAAVFTVRDVAGEVGFKELVYSKSSTTYSEHQISISAVSRTATIVSADYYSA